MDGPSSSSSASQDFCNTFWSADDSGVECVVNRLKNGSKALEDLRAFYKDRASIEEEYARKLARLSRQALGREETGSLKAALERVRMETAHVADAHDKLAAMMRTSLEQKTRDFDAGRDGRRRNPQASIEKLLKTRQQQELLVNKAREKYKVDCISINGYTAQTSLVQGRDLDKVAAKLDKAQATIQINEKEYKAYLNALKETTSRWNLDWKAFCDLVQDLEEERLNYMRISLWEYANGHSFICVTDDESCENIRKALEQCDAVADLADFVRRNATGNRIVDPPTFVNYASGDASLSKQTFKTANFVRSSTKQEIIHTGQSLQDLASAIKPSGTMSIHQAPSRDRSRPQSRNRSDSQKSASRPHSEYDGHKDELPRSSSQQDVKTISRQNSDQQQPAELPTSASEPIRDNYQDSRDAIRGYGQAFGRGQELSAQTQSQPDPPSKLAPLEEPKSAVSDVSTFQDATKKDSISVKTPSPAPTFGQSNPSKPDPIAMALAALRDPKTASEAAEKYSPLERQKSKSSLVGGRPASYVEPSPAPNHSPFDSSVIASTGAFQQGHRASSSAQGQLYAQSPQPAHRPISVSYGGVPPANAAQRPHSPYQPANAQPPGSPGHSAALMRPPSVNPNANQTQSVLASYGQALPGEQRSRSRANSVASHRSAAAQQASSAQQPQQQNATAASISYAAPQSLYQPFQQSTRPVSPRPQSTYAFQPHQQAGPAQSAQMQQSLVYAQRPPPIMQGRPISPAYSQPQANPAHMQQSQRPLAHQQMPSQSSLRVTSPVGAYQAQPIEYNPMASPAQQPFGFASTSGPPSYGTASATQSRPQMAANIQQQQQQSLTAAQLYAQQARNGMPTQHAYSSQPQSIMPSSQAPPPQMMSRPISVSNLHQPYQQTANQRRSPSPAQLHAAAPGPPPPLPQPQVQPQGRPVLFFVRAMYDYQAQIPEEFSFQADDIIAVFATDPDGWWQGELLDETRKKRGANTFPSNFCTLLE